MAKIVREGLRLRLRIADENDMDFIMASEADPESLRYIVPDSAEYHRKTLNSKEGIHLVAERKDTGKAVGFILVTGLDSRHHEQCWRRVIITDRDKGYGKEAMSLLFDWAFFDAGAHRGWLDCKEYNTRALHVYESLGLRREAFLREAILVDGKYENLVVLAILDREWRVIGGGKQKSPR